MSVSFNTSDQRRDAFMLDGPFAQEGYDWWWHSFTAHDAQTGTPRAFFVEFFTINPALGGAEPVLGQDPAVRARGGRPSYLMVKAGAWGDDAGNPPVQLHRFVGWDDVLVQLGAPYAVSADDCLATEKTLRGSVRVSPEEAADPALMCDAGSMSWDLSLDKRVSFNVGFGASKPLRDAEAFDMYWHAEGMKTLVSGTVTLNGRAYAVEPETSFGYADKNWGDDFTSPWVWLASSNLISRVTGHRLADTCFDIGGGCPKVFHHALPRQLLSALWHEGRPYEFNFSKAWTHCQTEFAVRETDEEIQWHVEQSVTDARMVTDARCRKDHMLLVNYEAPDGSRRHNRLWNGGDGTARVQLFERRPGHDVLVDDMDAANLGCEYGEYDAAGPYGA